WPKALAAARQDRHASRQASLARKRIAAHSAHTQQLYFEHQRRVRRDYAAGAARAVPQCGRDGELALAAYLHARNALVPTLDDAPGAKGKHEGVVAILARVEFGAVGKPAGIVHLHLLSGAGARH